MSGADTRAVGAAPSRSGDLFIREAGDLLVLVPRGCLDASLGELLLAALEALRQTEAGVVIDLCSINAFTEEGAAAVAQCLGRGDRVPRGLRFRADGGPGRRALISAVRLHSQR